MKVVVIGQTYLKQLNRDKWDILAKKYGYNVSLILMKHRNDMLFVAHLQPSSIVQIHTLPIVNNGNEPIYFFSPRKFIQLLKQLKPDIIHVENPTGSFVLLQTIIAKLLVCRKAKLVVFTWLNLPYPKQLKFWLYRLLEKINLRFVDALICGNTDGKKLFTTRGYSKPIHVVPQIGVDLNFFTKQDATELRKQLGIASDEFVFGSIGRSTAEKGLEDELHAFAQIAEKHPQARLLLVGKGPLQATLKELAKQLGIDQKVIQVDSVTHEQVVEYISACDAHILASYQTPTRKEQFGHILIECMSCGVPVIGSDSGEIPFVIGDAGLVFPARDIHALSNAMERFLTDADLREKLIQRGKKRVQEHYTHEKLAESLDAIYTAMH